MGLRSFRKAWPARTKELGTPKSKADRTQEGGYGRQKGTDVLTLLKLLQHVIPGLGDIACDPDSDYNPVPVYDAATDWQAPVVRVHDAPPLDVMAIDNLPSLLPVESSQDYAAQLLPSLLALDRPDAGVWGRARAIFDNQIKGV